MTYNDGGSRPGGLIGYRGVCSNPVILDNVKVRRRQSALADGPCRIFADSNFNGGRPTLQGREPWCYESTLLLEKPWRFGAGIYHRGPKEGEPIPIRQVSTGDVAILTTLQPNAEEADRFVFAVYRIGNISEDDDWGSVFASDGSMDLLLPDGVAPMLKFWSYYSNNKGGPDWRTGLFRYLNEDQVQTILAELMGAPGDRDERDLIYEAAGPPRLPAAARGCT